MDWLSDPQIWTAFLTLAALEIVLGIDNLVFISIVAGRLPQAQQALARRVGLLFAMITRLGLLVSLAYVVALTEPLFSLFGHDFSGRDLVLTAGGLFLLYQGSSEIHHRLEGAAERSVSARASFVAVIAQIALLDMVFSLDSIVAAVGMSNNLYVMASAIVVATIVMAVASQPLSAFVERHPSVKMLALSFLILIGATLLADGFGFHMPKGYVYCAIAFASAVEALNLVAAGRRRVAQK